MGLAISKDEVFVCDAGNSRIQVFDLQGNFLRKWGGPGVGYGLFQSPMYIAVSAVSDVFVSDQSNHHVQVFSSDGKFLHSWSIDNIYQESDYYFQFLFGK